jgi:5'-methylthioadenosine nucleosidase
MMIKRIGILVGMMSEARPLVAKLKLPASMSSDTQLKFDSWEGEFEETEIMVKTLGLDPRFQCPKIGPLPITLATYKLIEEFQPDIILNAGSAAAILGKGCQIGEIYLGQETVGFHDRRGGAAFADFCRGTYPIAGASKLLTHLNLKAAKISTGSSIDLEAGDWKEVERVGAQIRDFETAAAAWVAEMKGVPFLPMKLITESIAPKDTPSQPAEPFNYWAASENLSRKILETIQFLKVQSLEELN